MEADYTLHYGSISDINVIQFDFDTYDELIEFVKELINNVRNDIVYLMVGTMPEDDCTFEEIIITQDANYVKTLLQCDLSYASDCNRIHLHEYESYQAAYEVALMMRENNVLCYDR